jgi:hypothetical protein
MKRNTKKNILFLNTPSTELKNRVLTDWKSSKQCYKFICTKENSRKSQHRKEAKQPEEYL